MSEIVQFPATPDIQINKIPTELKEIAHWFLWRWVNRAGKLTKPPYQPNGQSGKVNDTSTWSAFNTVTDSLKDGKYAGVGFVLTEDLGLVAWDLDHCINPKTGELTDWAENIVNTLKSYTEITPSGEGLRVFARGSIPKAGTKKGPIECYKDKRYVTVTGNTFRYDKIITADSVPLFNSIFNAEPKKEADKTIDLLKEGQWKEAGFPSQSEADLVYCSYLAKQLQGDVKKIDEAFRASKLFRPKWDVVHHSDGTTYGQTTISKAIKSIKSAFALTDLGNAYRLSNVADNRIKYCAGTWFIWDEKRYKQDYTGRITYFAEDTIANIRQEAMRIDDPDLKKVFTKYASHCEGLSRIEAMIKLAATRKELVVTAQDLDKDQYHVNFNNGTLTRELELVPHDPNHLNTKLINVDYNETATCPLWESFLEEVLPNKETRDFLQRCVGYTLTGSTKEQKLFFLYGVGANGKSTFIETIEKLLHEYATTLQPQLLMASSTNQLESTHTMVADLRGVRLAIASETDDGRRLNESLIKSLTGDGIIKARYLYKDYFEFQSTAKVWIVGNHKPGVKGIDKGIWRRILLIPFDVTIPEHKQDRNLLEKLRDELPGIAKWAVDGLKQWNEIGLKIPQQVLAATEEYKVEQDVIQLFLEEEVVFKSTSKVLHSALYARYVDSMERKHEFTLPNRRFLQSMREKGHTEIRSTGNQLYWLGMEFLIPDKKEKEDM